MLTNKRWVHVPGDDDEGGAVYRDASGDIPPTRRPKEYLEFGDDGTVRKLATGALGQMPTWGRLLLYLVLGDAGPVRFLAPGAHDRAHEVDRTTWSQKDGKVVFNFGAAGNRGGEEHQIVEQAPDKLVIRKQ